MCKIVCLLVLQAILVVNDAARDALPEELKFAIVLTIFESKGLEFDDILLYNFFKDSQVSNIGSLADDLDAVLLQLPDIFNGFWLREHKTRVSVPM